MISYFLKTLKLIIIILNISYFLGILWWVMIEAEKEFGNGLAEYKTEEDQELYAETF